MKGSIPLIIFCCGLYLATLTSCQKDYLIPEEVLIPDSVSFSAHVIPLFESSCVSGCHETGKYSPDLSPENAHENLMLLALVDTIEPTQSVLYQRMISTTDVMPPPASGGKLSDSKIDLVLKWIEQGALDN